MYIIGVESCISKETFTSSMPSGLQGWLIKQSPHTDEANNPNTASMLLCAS